MPTPYYQDDFTRIYHARCEDILPSLTDKFDLLLTDPPYGIGENSKQQKSRGWIGPRGKWINATDYGEFHWDTRPTDETIALCLSKARKQIIWGGNFFALPPSPGWIVRDKLQSADFADCELAYTNLKLAVRKFTWKWNGMLQEDMSNKEKRIHPTQKPLALIKFCIHLAQTDKDKLKVSSILDPFAGSGSTLRAAKDLHIHSTGIEQDERYCELAAKRMLQSALDFAEFT